MSLVYLKNNKIYVYRDIFGKRSLILQYAQNEICISSSIVDLQSNYFEVPSDTLMVIEEGGIEVTRNL